MTDQRAAGDRRPTVGLIVNPVAGMGGRVGLKGTDGDSLARAIELGAKPVSPRRIADFLGALESAGAMRWLAAPGAMGADCLAEAGLPAEVIGALDGDSSADDTRRLARAMRDAGADLVVFAGGDGTARDMLDALGTSLPVVAIPAGVKIYSSVFAINAAAAAALVEAFAEGTALSEEEVLDIDEAAYREGRVASVHYGFMLVPEVAPLLQGGKEASDASAPTLAAREELGRAIAETLEPGVLYLLGCGTTLASITDALSLPKALLGIDALMDGRLVGADLNEQDILALLERHDSVRLIVTPLGGNGFIFGRGNRQLSPEVLARIGRDNIMVVAGRDKLLKLGALRVDTGDRQLDATLRGYIEVRVGRDYSKLMRVE